jgi:hypothetical protein
MGAKKHKEAEERPAAGMVDPGFDPALASDGKPKQVGIEGAAPPAPIRSSVLRENFIAATAAESEARKLRELAEDALARRVESNKNLPISIDFGDGKGAKQYTARVHKGADRETPGAMFLTEYKPKPSATAGYDD